MKGDKRRREIITKVFSRLKGREQSLQKMRQVASSNINIIHRGARAEDVIEYFIIYRKMYNIQRQYQQGVEQ